MNSLPLFQYIREYSIRLKLKKVTILFHSVNYTVKTIATRS